MSPLYENYKNLLRDYQPFIVLVNSVYKRVEENYEKVEDIGKGSFGVVTKIRRKSDGKFFVWKELNYGKMSEKEK